MATAKNPVPSYEESTINLGVAYMKELKRDREGFIAMLKKLKTVRGAADLFYCYAAIETNTIPKIETLDTAKKNQYWLMIKDEDLSPGQKLMFCRGLYALDKMIEIL